MTTTPDPMQLDDDDPPAKHPILLVDDESEILFSLRGLLRTEFDVHTAESGAEALEVLSRQSVHAIMTDQRMPNMTGVELLRRAKEERPEAVRMVFDLFADLAPWAIVEFVPKDDPMVRRLLATRRDVFTDYDLDGFRTAAATRFVIVREAPTDDYYLSATKPPRRPSSPVGRGPARTRRAGATRRS